MIEWIENGNRSFNLDRYFRSIFLRRK